MKILEAFFSTDKIIYPIILTIIFGILIKVLAFLANKEITDVFMMFFMFIGFILGNCIKIHKINNK